MRLLHLFGLFTSVIALSACLSLGGLGGGGSSTSTNGSSTTPYFPRSAVTLQVPTATVTVGTEVHTAPLSLPAGSGMVTVSGTGTPLDGITITNDPAGTGPALSVTLHYYPVNSFAFSGDAMSVKVGLVTVEAPGASSDAPLLITIPIANPTNRMIGASYLETDGSLTPVPRAPLIDPNPTWLVTRFGTYPSGASGASPAFFVGSLTNVPSYVGSPVTTALSRSSLNNQYASGRATASSAEADSGYRVTVDNCPFPNRGSAITPIGNCVGQTMLNRWFFLNEKKTAGDLYSLFPGNYEVNPNYYHPQDPKFAANDRRGIRLVSVLQSQYLTQYQAKFPSNTGALSTRADSSPIPPANYDDIFYAINTTHKPQPVGLDQVTVTTDKSGYIHYKTNPTHGHCVLCYYATQGYLVVDDPNYPYNGEQSNARFIQTNSNGTMVPYTVGLNADSPGTSFNYFQLLSADEWISDAAIATAYAGIATAGDSLFPTYKTPVFQADGTTLISNDVPDSVPTTPQAFPTTLTLVGSKFDISSSQGSYIQVWQLNGSTFEANIFDTNYPLNTPVEVNLTQSSTLIGLSVVDSSDHYVDWKYIEVNTVAGSWTGPGLQCGTSPAPTAEEFQLQDDATHHQLQLVSVNGDSCVTKGSIVVTGPETYSGTATVAGQYLLGDGLGHMAMVPCTLSFPDATHLSVLISGQANALIFTKKATTKGSIAAHAASPECASCTLVR